MYKFLRNVSTMTGKNFAAGMLVPDGVFGNLAEMVKAGDIAEVTLEVKESETSEPESVEYVEKVDKRATNLEKARAARAAKKAGK